MYPLEVNGEANIVVIDDSDNLEDAWSTNMVQEQLEIKDQPQPRNFTGFQMCFTIVYTGRMQHIPQHQP